MALEFLKRIFNPNKVEIELNEIQALILRSRPIPYFGTVAIIEIKDAVAARQMLQKLLPIVSSAEDWHKNEGASVTLTFTYKGLEKIGVPQESLDTFPESFKEGMAERSRFLYDIGVNDPKNWEKVFKRSQRQLSPTMKRRGKASWRNFVLN